MVFSAIPFVSGNVMTGLADTTTKRNNVDTNNVSIVAEYCCCRSAICLDYELKRS